MSLMQKLRELVGGYDAHADERSDVTHRLDRLEAEASTHLSKARDALEERRRISRLGSYGRIRR